MGFIIGVLCETKVFFGQMRNKHGIDQRRLLSWDDDAAGQGVCSCLARFVALPAFVMGIWRHYETKANRSLVAARFHFLVSC